MFDVVHYVYVIEFHQPGLDSSLTEKARTISAECCHVSSPVLVRPCNAGLVERLMLNRYKLELLIYIYKESILYS